MSMRLMQLEAENVKLERIVASQPLDIEGLKELSRELRTLHVDVWRPGVSGAAGHVKSVGRAGWWGGAAPAGRG